MIKQKHQEVYGNIAEIIYDNNIANSESFKFKSRFAKKEIMKVL